MCCGALQRIAAGVRERLGRGMVHLDADGCVAIAARGVVTQGSSWVAFDKPLPRTVPSPPADGLLEVFINNEPYVALLLERGPTGRILLALPYRGATSVQVRVRVRVLAPPDQSMRARMKARGRNVLAAAKQRLRLGQGLGRGAAPPKAVAGRRSSAPSDVAPQ